MTLLISDVADPTEGLLEVLDDKIDDAALLHWGEEDEVI